MIQTLNYQTAKNTLLTFRHINNVRFFLDESDNSINIFKPINNDLQLIGYIKTTKKNSKILKAEFAEYFK